MHRSSSRKENESVMAKLTRCSCAYFAMKLATVLSVCTVAVLFFSHSCLLAKDSRCAPHMQSTELVDVLAC